MKRTGLVLSSLAVGVVLAVGCSGDDRPIAPIEPDAGEANGGSTAGTTQGGKGGIASQGGKGGTSTGGSNSGGNAGTSMAGASSGESPGGAAGEGGTAQSLGGAGGDVGSDGNAGAGGDSAAGGDGAVGGPAPFAGPYTTVYAGPQIGVDFRPLKSATFASDALIDFVAINNEHRGIGTASNRDVGNAALVQWGRWADGSMGVTDTVALSATQGFLYAVGSSSPALPANGTQEYELLGATPVTVGDGSKPLGTVTASAVAAFSDTTHVGATFSLLIDGVTYTVTTKGGTATPATSEITAWLPQYPNVVSGVPVSPNTGICADGCFLSVQGFFAGANVENLAFAVHIFDGAGGSATSVSAVVVLKKKT